MCEKRNSLEKSINSDVIILLVFYRCGPKNIIQFGIQCSSYGKQWFPYSVQNAVDDAQSYAKNGLIDDLRNLKDNRVFIWTGGADEYIPRGKIFYRFISISSVKGILTINFMLFQAWQ